MKIIDKVNSIIPKPYTYLIKFNVNNEIKYYYGVRYGNVRNNILPQNDIFKKYFTSSKVVKNLLDDNIFPYEIIIHKIFETSAAACKFEVKFLQKLKAAKRKDFLNQVENFDNSLPNNSGRVFSLERRDQISKTSSKAQSSDDYRKKRSENAIERWKDPEYIEYMKIKNDNFKNSERGKQHFKNRNGTLGYKHDDETKIKMSTSMKEAAKSRDFSAAAKKRKIYQCPFCNLHVGASNYNRHLIYKHEIQKDDIINYPKIEITSSCNPSNISCSINAIDDDMHECSLAGTLMPTISSSTLAP